ncbi:uncharacterized protein N7484_010000 [Penicillium longicatenatum]|uniref:uncharacterized protein n=1 Tax=Penicillium longicatenatum TaxID=1561947 RepID=UPI002548144F|nr:uncharacterized protein N7484_010000 [Penicillium longicatenatum]KAJ5636687.1 hypothetical protein N7484_010000 [Penicillium longicatenatum]
MNDDFAAWIFGSELYCGEYGMDVCLSGSDLMAEETNGDMMDPELLQLQHVSSLWFTNVWKPLSSETPHSVTEGPMQGGSATLDEQYRQSIRKKLHISSYEPTIPSADTLNMCIHYYFIKTQPVFPIVHRATFTPCKAKANIIVVMCAFGILFTGSDHGLQQGLHFFGRIQKASLQTWENSVGKSREMIVSIIYGASLAQVFGMLSGSAKTLLNVDAFHGPPIAWARNLKLDQPTVEILIEPDIEGTLLEERWRSWARRQEIIRVIHALYIVDAELSSLLHHEPIQNFESYTFSPTCSEAVFMAPNSIDWKNKHLAETHQLRGQSCSFDGRILLSDPDSLRKIPVHSRFTAYAVLEGISMRVISSRKSFIQQVSARAFDQFLTAFYTRFLDRREQQPRHDPLQLDILWHLVYMETSADFNLLEKAIGREGSRLDPAELSTIIAWATSQDADRSILHASMIQKHVQAMSVVSEFAIHVPRALFWAGLALICYMRFGSKPYTSPHSSPPTSHRFPEFALLAMDDLMPITGIGEHGFDGAFSQKTLLFSIIDLLDRIGHWELARKFASILRAATVFVSDNHDIRV